MLPPRHPKTVTVLGPAESQDWDDRYVRVGQVEFECTERTCDSDPSEDRCLAGLGRITEPLKVDAVVPTEVTTRGRGHAGAEIWKVSCRGIAVRKQQRDHLAPPVLDVGEYELRMAEIADDFGDPPLLWGYTTLDPERVGIPICEGHVPPDSEDPVYPGVVLIESSPVDDLPALLSSTMTNHRDGTLTLDGCGVGLLIEERTPSGWRGKWSEWGILKDGRGTFTIRKIE